MSVTHLYMYIYVYMYITDGLISLVLTNTHNPQVSNNYTSRQMHVYIHVLIYTRIRIICDVMYVFVCDCMCAYVYVCICICQLIKFELCNTKILGSGRVFR